MCTFLKQLQTFVYRVKTGEEMEQLGLTLDIPVTAAGRELATRVLRSIADALESKIAITDAGEEGEDGIDTRAMSSDAGVDTGLEDSLRRLYQAVKPTARQVLRFVAEETAEAGESEARELRRRLGGVTESQLAGYLASIGFALKRVPNTSNPLHRGYRHDAEGGQRIYRMDRPVVDATLRLLDEQGQLQTP
jgi:hypothetical protein